MRKNLIALPFLALLLATLAYSSAAILKERLWLSYGSWSLSALFLLTWLGLEGKSILQALQHKGARYGATSSLSVSLALCLLVGVATLTTRPTFNKSYDISRNGINTLSDQSRKTVQQLSLLGIKTTIIASFQDEIAKAKFSDLLALYQENGLSTEIEWLDPQRDPTRILAEKITQANTVLFKTKQQEARITSFTEEKLTNALAGLGRSTAKKVYFSTGHGESSIQNKDSEGYFRLQEELRNAKYDAAELPLLQLSEIPADADLIVLAGPRYDLRVEELLILKKYLNSGKPMLAMLDAMVPVPRLNSLLRDYGLAFADDLLIIRADDPRAQLLGQNNAIVGDFDPVHPLTRDFAQQSAVALLSPNTRSVELHGENLKQMKSTIVASTLDAVVTIKDVKTEKDLGALSSDRIKGGSAGVIAVAAGRSGSNNVAKNDSAETDAKRDVQAPPSGGLKQELRIVAMGSAKIAANSGIEQSATNLDMVLSAIGYLLQDEDFIAIRPKDAAKSTIDLTTPSSQLSLLFISYVYPFIFLALGVIGWFQRRRA